MSDEDQMAAIATVPNPLKAGKLMIFSSGANNMLHFENRTIDGDALAALGSKPGDGSVGPVLAFPSQLVSAVYKDMIAVYGIANTAKADAPAPVLELTLLSPITASIKQIKPVAGSLTGYVDKTRESGYLYMLTVEKGTTYITEWGLTNKGSDMRTIKDISSFMAKTSLGFVYEYDKATNAETRFLIYQQADASVGMFNMKSKQTTTVTGSKGVAAKPTSVAAVVVPADEAAGRKTKRIVVYFIANSDNDQHLFSANCKLTDAPDFTQGYEKPQAVGKGYACRQFSQLSIYLDEPNKRTIVYAMNSLGEFTPMYHDWADLLGQN